MQIQKKLFIFSLILTFSFFGYFADAQVRSTDIVLTVNPEHLRSGQDATAALNSFVVDLNKANISWSVNGEQKIIGIGEKTFSFNTGEGSTLNVSANIETVDGQNVQKSINMSLAEVDMLWEAYDAYVPPFYRGKALTPSQGQYKIVAMPDLKSGNGGRISSSNLSYSWKQDGKIKADSSGWGKNSYIFQNSYLDKTNTIATTVSDITGSTKTSSSITVRPVNPQIFFYRNDPVFGTEWNKAISGSHALKKGGDTIVAEPYYFSPKNLTASELTFQWYINGSRIGTPEPKNALSVRPEEDKVGTAVVKVLIENTKTLFQSLERQINLNF